MPADFTLFSNYKKENAFRQVVWSGDTPVLEIEQNEEQQIISGELSDLITDYFSSGFVGGVPTYSFSQVTNTITMNPAACRLGNLRAYVTSYVGASQGSTNNIIALGALPTSGTISAIIILEVWIKEVTYTDTIPYYGGLNSGTLTNNIEDTARIGGETTRRYQLQWNIRTIDGQTSITSVPAQGPLASPSSVDFVASGDYYVASSSSFGTVDNNIYALPLFSISMSTTTTTITDLRKQSVLNASTSSSVAVNGSEFVASGAIGIVIPNTTTSLPTPANTNAFAMGVLNGEPYFWDINTQTWVPFRSYEG